MDYYSETKAYKLYNHAIRNVIVCRDVMFHENKLLVWDDVGKREAVIMVKESTSSVEMDSSTATLLTPNATIGLEGLARDTCESNTNGMSGDTGCGAIPMDGFPPRRITSLTDVYNFCTFALNVTDLSCFNEEVRCKEWKDATTVKISTIQSNNTWYLTKLPSG